MLKISGLDDARLNVPDRAGMARIVNAEMGRWAPSVVQAAVAAAPDRMSRGIAASGQIKKLDYGVSITFAGKGPSRGLVRQFEFGTPAQEAKETYPSRSPRGKSFRVTRRTQRQIPKANSDGRFIYPAVARCTPQLVSALVRAMLLEVTADAR